MIAGCQWTKYANTLGSVSTECPLIEWDACGNSKKDQVDTWVEAGGAASHITDEKED